VKTENLTIHSNDSYPSNMNSVLLIGKKSISIYFEMKRLSSMSGNQNLPLSAF